MPWRGLTVGTRRPFPITRHQMRCFLRLALHQLFWKPAVVVLAWTGAVLQPTSKVTMGLHYVPKNISIQTCQRAETPTLNPPKRWLLHETTLPSCCDVGCEVRFSPRTWLCKPPPSLAGSLPIPFYYRHATTNMVANLVRIIQHFNKLWKARLIQDAKSSSAQRV